MSQNQSQKLLVPSIKVEKLTPVDWKNIALKSGYEITWGFFRWKESTDVDFDELTKAEMNSIGAIFGEDGGWVNYWLNN